jgi:hypothetical protein
VKKIKIFFYQAVFYTYLQVSRKGFFFYNLFISSSIFDQPCKDSPGQPRQESQEIQDSRGKIELGTRMLGQES